MSNGKLPDYLSHAKPNPQSARAPWYKNIAPSYAGIFLWVVFYKTVPGFAEQMGVWYSLLALVIAGLLCHYLYYLVPGLFGMQTGYPLYVIGSSTYGSKGGFLVPGLLMGLLQFGWVAVNGAVASDLLLQGFGRDAAFDPVTKQFDWSFLYTIIVAVWIFFAVFMGVKGIQYIAKVATFVPLVPLAMLLIGFVLTVGGLGNFEPLAESGEAGGNGFPLGPFMGLIAMVIGFFATAGAAGVDFGMNSRNEKDVQLGGLTGIALAVLVAGGLTVLITAGAHGQNPDLGKCGDIDSVIKDGIGGFLSSSMFFLFAIASFAPACFASFVGANSLGTLLPKIPKMLSAMIMACVSIVIAATGLALDLVGVFSIIGASFGPICGAMAADFIISGNKWTGPRKGINWAGYISWAAGFYVGITEASFIGMLPDPVDAFVVGFLLYPLLALLGFAPEKISLETEGAASESPE